ncbi:hypothetical protein KUTeg_011878 [Tegillarca granosa]|uniref:Uncharacterized protein n=1 Tax=Tegillarca granosa TaxID=220873 RepID=A0ABQ9EXX6_TEGGR|nr:hypothetical protein KUTeg_011878 [Tegillarca granosa]
MAHQDCDSDADDDTEEEMDEDVSPETWENLSEEDLNEDLGLPVQTRSGIKNVNDLLFWKEFIDTRLEIETFFYTRYFTMKSWFLQNVKG